MGPITLKVRYRPIRIGWCVKENDIGEYRKAVRLTHAFSSGRFNPIIPVGDIEAARLIIKAFRLDVLYCVSESPGGSAILAEFKHLMWPSTSKDLFVDYWGHGVTTATFLDVDHSVSQIYNENIKGRHNPVSQGTLFRWNPADALADVFLATFGGYSPVAEINKDYEFSFCRNLLAEMIEIPPDGPVPPRAFSEFTPSALTAFGLAPISYEWSMDRAGIYYGHSGDFDDLVNFWNLRASGREVLFYDPVRHPRLIAVTEAYIEALGNRPKSHTEFQNDIVIWSKNAHAGFDLKPFGDGISLSSVSRNTWNVLKPSVMGFEEKSVLGMSSGDDRLSVTFELPPKPFFEDGLDGQQVVVSVHPLVQNENVVLKPPFFPPLNEYYGRHAHFEYNTARSEREGLGVITALTTTSLTLRALDVRSLVQNIFKVLGIEAKPSNAGLVGLRLIEQMGGIQGCRAFKIAGVRELIKNYPPDQSFTRSCAKQTIRQVDPISGEPQFAEYASLYIDGKQPKPEDVFEYLLNRGVFRPGLRFLCPNCQLESWVHLDAARTINGCEYCGKEFNVTSQLRDRDWAYRRSGLFGRTDNQGGGIPVALTLMQLQTAMRESIVACTTGTKLIPGTVAMEECESDFIVIVRSPRDKALQIAIGECKSDGGEITQEDVRKLGKAADAMASAGCETFIIFSKTSAFLPEEVARCRNAQDSQRRRVILFSKRELEPYYLYERTSSEFEISPYASTLEQMVTATHHSYFEPKMKPTPGTG